MRCLTRGMRSTDVLLFLCSLFPQQHDVIAFQGPSLLLRPRTFTDLQQQTRVSFVKVNTRLEAFKKPPPPEDPYAELLRNYQKKGAGEIITPSPESSPATPTPPPLPTPEPIVEPPVQAAAAPAPVDIPTVDIDTDSPTALMGAAAAKAKAAAAASVTGGLQVLKDNAQKSISTANEAVSKQIADTKEMVGSVSAPDLTPASNQAMENLGKMKENLLGMGKSLNLDFGKYLPPPPSIPPIQVPETTTRGIITLENNVKSAEWRAVDTLLKKGDMNAGMTDAHYNIKDLFALLDVQNNLGWCAAALILVFTFAGKTEEATGGGSGGDSTKKELRKEIKKLKSEMNKMKKSMEKQTNAEIKKLTEENTLLKQQLASSSATGSTFPTFAANSTALFDDITGDEDAKQIEEGTRLRSKEEARLEKAKKVEEMVRAELKAAHGPEAAQKKKMFEAAARKAVAEALENKKPPKKKAGKKAAKKKTTVAKGGKKVDLKKPVVAEANGVHPWATLAPSTLSRKTVKELSDFLQEKGVSSVDDNGKKMMKKDLLSKVKSLL